MKEDHQVSECIQDGWDGAGQGAHVGRKGKYEMKI